MPELTGAELARKILLIRPDIPIVLCTGFSEKIDEKYATDLGIQRFLKKPVAMGELLNIIVELLQIKESNEGQ